VASPSIGPVKTPKAKRGDSDRFQLTREEEEEEQLVQNQRLNNLPPLLLSPQNRESSEICLSPSLGEEVAIGSSTVSSIISSVLGNANAKGELQRQVSCGDANAAVMLEIFEILESSEEKNMVFGLEYVANDLLPMLTDEPDLRLQSRIVLCQIEVVFRNLLEQLDSLSESISFWEDLEGNSFRTNVILSVRNRSFQHRWVSLQDTVEYLNTIFVSWLRHLGRLKHALLCLEDVSSVVRLEQTTKFCINELKDILGIVDSDDFTKYCLELNIALERQEESFLSYISGFEQVPRYIKYWPEITCGVVFGVGLISVAMYRKADAYDFLSRVLLSWNEFYVEHVKKPLAALVDEILFDHTLQVSDSEAMIDAKLSLGRMLEDYVRDVDPNADAATLASIRESMDVSILSQQYEAELKKPIASLVSGDLVRMLLIQMQFMKKELLVVMTALDELIRENQFNLELMATVPAFIVTWSVYQVGVYTVRALMGTKSTKPYVFKHVRLLLRDVEQLLNLNFIPTANDFQKTGMREVTLGRLVLLIHQLERALFQNLDFFDRHERKRLAEDVSEISSDQLSVQQKLHTIDRMYRSYTFLQPTSQNLERLFRRLV